MWHGQPGEWVRVAPVCMNYEQHHAMTQLAPALLTVFS